MLRKMSSFVLLATVACATAASAQSIGESLELVEVRALVDRDHSYTATIMRSRGSEGFILTNATARNLRVLDANLVVFAVIKPGRALDLGDNSRVRDGYLAISFGPDSEPVYLEVIPGGSARIEPQSGRRVTGKISREGDVNE